MIEQASVPCSRVKQGELCHGAHAKNGGLKLLAAFYGSWWTWCQRVP